MYRTVRSVGQQGVLRTRVASERVVPTMAAGVRACACDRWPLHSIV